VLLRLTIGWHILYEGLWKLEQDEFSSEGFLSQASGPLAEHFRYEVINDYEGRDRLAIDWNQSWMDKYKERFVKQFGVDDATAVRIVEARKASVKQYLDSADNKLLITQNQQGWEQLRERKADRRKGKTGVPYEDKGIYEAAQKLRADIAPALAWTKEQRDGLKTDLKNLLPLERRGEELTLSIGERLADRDLVVTYACVAIGFCLMIGLFTRLSALGGAVFLAMIVASRWEWPGYYAPPAHPAQGHSLFITKEFIEMMCCLVLATLPVGRWGGLDFFIHNLLVRPFLVKKD